MEFEIREEGPGEFAEHGLIPIAFVTESRLDLQRLRASGGDELLEIPMPARLKNYDDHEEERPPRLHERFNLENWALLAAYLNSQRIGGVILARDCPEYDLLKGRKDLALIVDIRVAPSCRRLGVGQRLLGAACKWAKSKGCREIRAETQDINLAACRSYAAGGFHLASIDENAYGPGLEETRLIWQKNL